MVSCVSHQFICIFVVSVIVIVSVDNSLADQDNEISLIPELDKRYAMMSFNYGSRGRHGSKYGRNNNRRIGGSGTRYGKTSYRRPWELLPDNHCYRKRCTRSSDCCRRYNLCDPQVKVCYDCWYGYKCNTSNDCCQRYPYCHPKRKTCYN